MTILDENLGNSGALSDLVYTRLRCNGMKIDKKKLLCTLSEYGVSTTTIVVIAAVMLKSGFSWSDMESLIYCMVYRT